MALLVGGCDGGSDPPPAPPPPQVVVAEVSQESIPVVFHFSGTLQAIRSVNIIPRVGGFIEKRYFVEGTRVNKDDPLYLIDPGPTTHPSPATRHSSRATRPIPLTGTLVTAHQGQWIIAKGLKMGERVVVVGTQKVRDGLLVELKAASAPKG